MNYQQHFIDVSFQAGRYILHIIDKMVPEKASDIFWIDVWLTYKLTNGLEGDTDQSYDSVCWMAGTVFTTLYEKQSLARKRLAIIE